MYGLHQQGFVRYTTASVQYHEYVEERLISTLHKFYGHLFKLVDRYYHHTMCRCLNSSDKFSESLKLRYSIFV